MRAFNISRTILFATLFALAASSPALAVTGTLSPVYGPPLAIQTSQSNVGGGDPFAQVNESVSAQLDAAYAYVSDGTLHLFLTGNLSFWVQLEGGIMHWLPLDVFIDCAPGGQHQLLANNPAPDLYYDLNSSAGLTFDTGFAADYWLSCGAGVSTFEHLRAYFGALPTGGGGSGAFLGATLPGPPGVLSGGANPYGIEVTFDDSNRLGLGSGCGVPALPSVATGIEWAIPLAAIGNPTGCIRITAYVGSIDHSQVSNQVMGPIPPGTCSMVAASAVDFSAIPGDQFFMVCPATAARFATWGRLKTLYR